MNGLEHIATDLAGARVGLVAHQASIDPTSGRHTAERLKPVRLFGPEHGFFGWGAAGEKVLDAEHPWLGVPIVSLYGENRKPRPEQLEGLDVIVVDLQDLGLRCYTFLSTLALVMEAAGEADLPVVVLERPVPMPGRFDGPRLKPGFENFVAQVDVPFSYGLTPGEAARWLVVHGGIEVDLDVVGVDPGPFEVRIPPSPAIRSRMTCQVYPATVFAEACPTFDVDRHGPIPFQTLCAEGMVFEALPDLPGASLHRHINAELVPGVRIHVEDLSTWDPVAASVRLLASMPPDLVWREAREAFFDKLYGTDEVRLALQDGEDADTIIERWQPGLAEFAEEVLPLRSVASLPFSERVRSLLAERNITTLHDLLAEAPDALGNNKACGEIRGRLSELGVAW